MDGVTALERAYEAMGKRVANLTADQLSIQSACSEWDLRALLNHAFGAGWMFTLVNQGQTLGEDSGDVVGDDPAAACAELAAANVASWKAAGGLEGERTYPFGTFPAEMALVINVGEILIHAWDVAKATGQDATIDPEAAELLYGLYGNMPLDMYREYGAFGPEVQVPESAPIADRLLGLLGFQP
jgi:uncharacterized protein (TIGR03086 family)